MLNVFQRGFIFCLKFLYCVAFLQAGIFLCWDKRSSPLIFTFKFLLPPRTSAYTKLPAVREAGRQQGCVKKPTFVKTREMREGE